MSTGYFPKRTKIGLEDLFRGLVTANHILHHQGVLDAFGHISVRSPDNKNTFYLSCNMAPALVSSPDDIVEYHVESGEAVEKDAKPGFLERYIHSEIYKRFPEINSVVHSHAGDVLPYCMCDVPLRAGIHMAGFLGTKVPVWSTTGSYTSSSKHDLLVTDTTLGASLAATFKPATSAGFIYSKVRSALPSQLGGSGSSSDLSREPDHAVVLQENHGFTTIADGIETAVYQAVYTKESAKAQTTALIVQKAFTGYALKGQVDVEGGGTIKAGKATMEGGLRYMDVKQAQESWASISETVMRPWALWDREVEVHPLYRNACPSGDD